MSSFIWISLFKTCRRDLQSMESVWPKTRSEWSGQCDGMTLHQGTQVREGWTNHSRVLARTDQWEASMTLPTQAWLAIAPGPALSQARPAFLSPAQYIKYFFQPSPYILANKSLDIFTNKLRPETKFKIRRWGYENAKSLWLWWCPNVTPGSVFTADPPPAPHGVDVFWFPSPRDNVVRCRARCNPIWLLSI